MAWDWTSFAVGGGVGLFLGILLFTPTGRVVSARVGRATGERLAYHIEPRRRR